VKAAAELVGQRIAAQMAVLAAEVVPLRQEEV
jgi:hypothetical protein